VSSDIRTWPALNVAGLPPSDAADAHEAVQGDLLEAALTDFDVEAIDESAPTGWRVFFRTRSGRDRAQQAIAREFPTLTLTSIDVPDEDWAARSQASLKAVRVGNLIVAPPWDAPIVVAIRPSMGFGTGHHATTRLCLAALQALEVKERTVIDVGTGSGVLAIAASRLGAADVTAIDDDADAIHAAWENLALNPGAQASLIEGDFRRTEIPPADVVLANLTGALLIDAAERLRRLVSAHGRMILSGFMTHEEAAVRAAYAAFSVEHRAEEDGWVGMMLT